MHVDDYVQRHGGDPYARWMLMLFRLPAVLQILARQFVKTQLFCTYAGERWRVTNASRFGDIGLSPDFEKEHGYEVAADVADCSEWGWEP